jgi:biopolymer transport protein ExbB/TolQ
MSTAPERIELEWTRLDIEQRLGFNGGKFTRVNTLLSVIIGGGMTVLFYVVLLGLEQNPWAESFVAMFTQRGPVPYAISFFSFWAVAMLVLKSRKLALQARALDHKIIPPEHDFILEPATVDLVMGRLRAVTDDPRHFVLYNRIVIALSNLKNLRRVSDVDEILNSQAAHDESAMETSYSLLNGFVWAIPVLGFIGTVLGLSEAIGEFGSVLQGTDQLSEIKQSLEGVASGLATAFETTLEALVAALLIQLFLTFLKKSEEEFLDACSDYCLRHVVNNLRVTPLEYQNGA